MAFLIRAATRLTASLAAMTMLFVMASSAPAQWLNLPLPGTPRIPDGSPNLAAPTPRTADGKPDLSGIWSADRAGRYLANLAGEGVEVEMYPASASFRARLVADDAPAAGGFRSFEGRLGWSAQHVFTGMTLPAPGAGTG